MLSENIEQKRQDAHPLAIDIDTELYAEPVDARAFLDLSEPIFAGRRQTNGVVLVDLDGPAVGCEVLGCDDS